MSEPRTNRVRRARTGAAVALLLCAGGCASGPKPSAETAVFFPAAPELPRIQFLTSFTGRNDIEAQSGFDKFVVGEKANIKVDKPYGVGIYDGRIYVCDTNTGIQVFDLKKRVFEPFTGAVGPGGLRQPVNISIDKDGLKYVSDPVRGQVVVFDRNDRYVRAYGTPGPWRPVDAVPFEGNLYVVDAANGLVKVFGLADGELVRTIGDKGEPSERIDRPTNITFDSEGYLYVTDIGRFQVVKFDRDGHFRAMFGKAGDQAGHFARPKGIAVDREGRLLAVDASFNNVQLFNKEGRLLMFFGGGGEKRGEMLLPAKVTIDYDNLEFFQKYVDPNFQVGYVILVTSQFGPRRINVFAYGQEKGRKYPTDAELLQQVEERRKREQEKAQPPAKPPEQPPKPPGS